MASRRSGKLYLYTWVTITLLCLLLPGVNSQATISQGPVNSASMIGQASDMRCRTEGTVTENLEWVFFANGTGSGERAYMYDPNNPNNPQLPMPDQFEVDPSGVDSGVFDLIIKDTSTATAGRFMCLLYTQDLRREANFVSVSGISCSPEPTEYDVGQAVELVCEATYTGYKPPGFRWYTDTGDYSGEWTWNYEKSTLLSNITASADLDMVEFTCDLTFNQDVGDTMPPPTYNDSCSTYFMVRHGASSVIITPDPDGTVVVGVGSFINCTASGRPTPVISWEEVGGEIFMTESLRVLEEWVGLTKIFTCVARNDLNGRPVTASLNITIQVVTDGSSPPSSDDPGTPAWVIAVAVVVPVVVLAGAGGGAAAYVKHRKKKDKERYPEVPRGPRGPGTGQPFSNIKQPGINTAPRGLYPGHGPGGPGQPGGPVTNGKAPLVVGGIPLDGPNGTETDQQQRSGKDSPGYGDLGIKHFSSTGEGLNASVEMDPDPRYVNMNTHGSMDSLGGPRAPRQARGPMGSQGSLGNKPRPFRSQASRDMEYQPEGQDEPPRSARGPMGSQASLGYQLPPHVRGSQGSINRLPMAQGQMGSQGSINRLPMAQAHMGSQGSINQIQAARGNMGSQGSLSHIQAARGYMGSQASLASQGSRGYGRVALNLPHDVPDTTV